MKNLTERIKGFFTVFRKWFSTGRSIYVNVNTPEYRKAFNDYLEHRKANDDIDWFDDYFIENSFCTAYILEELKNRGRKRKKLRHEMRNAFFRMIFFWIS